MNPISDHSPKSRRSKTREVSSRFLSPASSIESGISSPPPQASPPPIKRSSTTTKLRKEENVVRSGLWPSTTKKKSGTLADHLGNDRLKDLLGDGRTSSSHSHGDGPQLLNRQRSCTEFNRFEKEKEKEKGRSKENHRPLFGGSMRYTGKLFPGKSSSSSTKSSSFTPGRLSVDENNLNGRRNSDSFAEMFSSECSESECSDYGSKTSSSSSYLASTASSRSSRRVAASGIEVSSRYLHDATTKSCSYTHSSSNNSNNLPPKMVKRANSLTAYKSTVSQWALSPGRTTSPPMSVENKGKPLPSFSNLRPPHSPSRSKGVGNLFSKGLDLFKSKKSSANCLSPGGHGVGGESGHQLRMLHNGLVQWRYVNARTEIVNANKLTQAERTLLNATVNLSKLQTSVAQKRAQFEKERLEFKLNKIIHPQVKGLETWSGIERQHVSSLSTTTDCLHSVVCRVPLVEGAKVDQEQTSAAIRHAVDLTSSIKTMLAEFSPMVQKEGDLLIELAKVATTEKSLLEECFDLVETLSDLEIQEKSLQCGVIQLRSQQQQCRSRQHLQDFVK